jgi:5'-3' exonuclease
MGVPSFYSWLRRKFNKNQLEKKSLGDIQIEKLYFDANCLVHPQCFKLLAHFSKKEITIPKLEEMMMDRVMNYIDYLIAYVKPENGVYIAIDGVAPAAKMNQQRVRRFKSVYDEELKKPLKKKFGIEEFNKWSNAVITPGTDFMERLHKRILKYINSVDFVKIQYSSYHTPGEGEHKIMEDLRKNGDIDKNYVIYGLDADLIFLSLASGFNIYLLRESVELGTKKRDAVKPDLDPVKDVSEDLDYIPIEYVREAWYNICKTALKRRNESSDVKIDIDGLNSVDLSNDFIVACYFLGNDFLPHIPSLEIHRGGLDLVLNAYVSTYEMCQCNMIEVAKDGIYVNIIFLEEFIIFMSNRENYYFRELLPEYINKDRNKKPRGVDDTPFAKALWKLDNMKFEVDDPIKLGQDDPMLWKYRYYSHHTMSNDYQDDTIYSMCEKYMHGVKWVTEYYFRGCPSWTWNYPYHHAPFISDLSHFLQTSKYDHDNVSFDKKASLRPTEQLLAVLPPQMSHLLPKPYNDVMINANSEMLEYYPEGFKVDMINIGIFWKATPIIPFMNIDKLRQITQKIKLSKSEQKRNEIQDVHENEFIY